LLLACLLLLGGCYLFFNFRYRDPDKPTVDALRNEIVTQLPAGSSQKQVERWLQSKHIGYSYKPRSAPSFDRGFDVESSGYPPGTVGGKVSANILHTGGGFLSDEDMYLVFLFDRRGRLLAYSVAYVSTQP